MFDNPEAAFFQGALNGSRNNVRNAIAEIHKANAAIQDRDNLLREAYARISVLQAEAARAAETIDTLAMDRAGLIAQFEAFKVHHPNSPLFADSGKRFDSGKIKSKVRIVFETGFDAKGAELDVLNPKKRRLD